MPNDRRVASRKYHPDVPGHLSVLDALSWLVFPAYTACMRPDTGDDDRFRDIREAGGTRGMSALSAPSAPSHEALEELGTPEGAGALSAESPSRRVVESPRDSGRTRWARPSQAQSSYSSYPRWGKLARFMARKMTRRTDPFEKSWKQETRRRWQEQERAREQERRQARRAASGNMRR